jgi:hypothetical protein
MFEDSGASGPGKTRTEYFDSFVRRRLRNSTAILTRWGSWPSIDITGPLWMMLDADDESRKGGIRGGEILARTLILLRKGIVMTVASTEPSWENGVKGVMGVVVFSGASLRLRSGCGELGMLPILLEWIIGSGLGWWSSGRVYGDIW